MPSLPLKKVVLYKHGVGYFERQGTVVDDMTVELQFKAAEMNDVLKSLTLLDRSGGIISSISYESMKPIQKQLAELPIQLPDKSALTGLLSQLQGAPVTVEVGSTRVEGVVIGIETVTRQLERETVWTSYLSLLVGGSTLQTFDLLEISRLTLLDPSLQKDLGHLLEILFSAKKKDLKRLTIFARGAGERKLVASYIVETPVWKTSYRMILDPEKPPLIQGWALVDNTEDEDWEDVSLTLVAGLPISFVHDLYSPRYKRRPVVQVQEETAYAPPVLEEPVDAAAARAARDTMDSMDSMDADDAVGADDAELAAEPEFALGESTPVGNVRMPQAAQISLRRSSPPTAPQMQLAASPPPPMPRGEALRRSALVQTRTAAVGDLFEYAIENTVTVKRNQSALVPILQRPFEGRRVAVYNPSVREKNPMSAVLFRNTTGMTLEGGPVTVLEEESYVGESMLETMKPDEERLIPFSVELGCLITVDNESERETVHLARIVGGTLQLHRYRVEKTVYAIKSKLARALELYLEHRFWEGWKLIDTPSPVEKTESFYRFRVDVPPGQTTRFVVVEKGDLVESWQIQRVSRQEIALWLEKRYIDEKTQQTLAGLIDLSDKVTELERWIEQRTMEIRDISDNQKRLRENLSALGTSRDEQGLRQRYVEALSTEEDRLAQTRAQVQGWREEKAALEQTIAGTMRSLKIETRL